LNVLRKHAEIGDPQARRLLGNARNGDLAETLRAVLKSRLLGRWPTISETAELANLSVRSLQRKLASVDVVFADLVDQVRAELAAEMLEDANVTMGEITKALGYSTSSNFARAFQRWTGETPAEFRRRKQEP
jgi:AraC-like DNA-binding protein